MKRLSGPALLSCLHFDQTSLAGVFVFAPTSANVTVMFPTGAGVEVRLIQGTMTTTVLLPEEFKDSTRGLLGKMNGDASDDLVLSNGQAVQNHSNPEELFSFGASCKEINETSDYWSEFSGSWLELTYLCSSMCVNVDLKKKSWDITHLMRNNRVYLLLCEMVEKLQ